MNNPGTNFNWLWVYGLGAFIGLLASEAIEKIAKAIRTRFDSRRRKRDLKIRKAKTNLVLIKGATEKSKFKPIHPDLRTDLRKS